MTLPGFLKTPSFKTMPNPGLCFEDNLKQDELNLWCLTNHELVLCARFNWRYGCDHQH